MTTLHTTDASYAIEVIGRLHSCFPDKFGVPRQPRLSAAARGEIEVLPPFDRPEAFRGLEGISHIWVTFLFHENLGRDWQPTIRPPRLGGNKRIGVFASRSSFRPNGLGLSLLTLTGVSASDRGVRLTVEGVDMIDQTPIVDIKPYLPYADVAPDAHAGWADEPPETRLDVRFSPEAERTVADLTSIRLPTSADSASTATYPMLDRLIVEVLSADPRPSYRRGKPDTRVYGTRLYDLDIQWRVDGDQVAWVVAVIPFGAGER
jgi:tRNA-Thr(GGU) m(6)t(6)A37 methyltransferase TsaA